MNVPGPGTYDNKSKGDQRGAKFGKDQRGKEGPGNKLSPGPGAYNQYDFVGKEAPKITMVPRRIHTSHVSSPGPGTYSAKL